MSADVEHEALFTLAEVELEISPTEAMRRGEQLVHQCAWCGTVVVWHKTSQRSALGVCPCCGADSAGKPSDTSQWWQQALPVAGVGRSGTAARLAVIDDLVAEVHRQDERTWDSAELVGWLDAHRRSRAQRTRGDSHAD